MAQKRFWNLLLFLWQPRLMYFCKVCAKNILLQDGPFLGQDVSLDSLGQPDISLDRFMYQPANYVPTASKVRLNCCTVLM